MESLPQVLTFLQKEWRRFERERNEWEVERADLRARIATLEGERRGLDNSREHLLKRVRMLEAALIEERNGNGKPTQSSDLSNILKTNQSSKSTVSSVNLRNRTKSRELLKLYMEEANKLVHSHELPQKNKSLPPIQTVDSLESLIPAASQHVPEIKKSSPLKTIGDSLKLDSIETFHIPVPEKPKESVENVYWKLKYTLRNHLDVVRSIQLNSKNHTLISTSDDGTAKYWNLDAIISGKKLMSDVEPLRTMRGHRGAVTCSAIVNNGEQCLTGGIDASIILWNLPNNSDSDPYDAFNPSIKHAMLIGHSDVVWDLCPNPSSDSNLVLSCSADTTIKLWDLSAESKLKHTIGYYGIGARGSNNLFIDKECEISPTQTQYLQRNNQFAASYQNGIIRLFDIETAKIVATLTGYESQDIDSNDVSRSINALLVSDSLLFSGCEDKTIKMHDIRTEKCIHSMVAHLDSVSSLALYPNDTTLVSGGHDSSVRLWDLNSKACVQEFASHRKKNQEGVLDIKIQSGLAYLITSGADSTIKLYTP